MPCPLWGSKLHSNGAPRQDANGIGRVETLWGTNIRSCRFPLWKPGGDPNFVVSHGLDK